MAQLRRRKALLLVCAGAWLLGLCWMLLVPGEASAHAILLRSNPARNAVLHSAPVRIQMWFSEDLSPTFTTSYVVNAVNSMPQMLIEKTTHVDLGDARVAPGNPKELEVSLKPHLPWAVYFVYYRTRSAQDGHILSGSFLFKVAKSGGTVPAVAGSLPQASQGTLPTTVQFDGATFFSFLMVTLVELSVVFWVGAQLWRIFVVELAEVKEEEQQSINREVVQRFDRLFATPALLVLLVANLGILVSQALAATGGQWLAALSPSLLYGLVATGNFGTWWLMREIVTALALVLAQVRRSPPVINTARPWVNLVLGLVLLVVVALSGHAAAVNKELVISSVLLDWLHLLAAALWVGGMLYLAMSYLPVLRSRALKERVAALLSTLSHYSPLAITGVIVMSVSGPFNAVTHVLSWEELLTTAYGRTLIAKVLLVGGLLLTSAVHVFLFRPSLKKTHRRYMEALEAAQPGNATEIPVSQSMTAREVKDLEGSVQRQATRLITTLRWEPLLGVAVLISTGLLSVFAGTLQPATTAQGAGTLVQQGGPAKPFVTTVKTTDGLLGVTCTVSPNRRGTNVFSVRVLDKQGKPATGIGVSIYATLLDMDMGTETVNLQPDGKGNFSANGDLNMSGNWQIRIEIRTSDNTLHEAQVKLFTTQ